MKYGINTKPTPNARIEMKLATLRIAIMVFGVRKSVLSSSLGVFEFK